MEPYRTRSAYLAAIDDTITKCGFSQPNPAYDVNLTSTVPLAATTVRAGSPEARAILGRPYGARGRRGKAAIGPAGIGSGGQRKAVGPAVKARLRARRARRAGWGWWRRGLRARALRAAAMVAATPVGSGGVVFRGDRVAGGVADGVLSGGGGAQLRGAVPDHACARILRRTLGRWRWRGDIRFGRWRRRRAGAGTAAGGGDDAVGDRLGRVAAARVLAQDEEGGGHVPVAQRLLDRLPRQDHQAPDLLRLRQRVDRVPGLDQGGEIRAAAAAPGSRSRRPARPGPPPGATCRPRAAATGASSRGAGRGCAGGRRCAGRPRRIGR